MLNKKLRDKIEIAEHRILYDLNFRFTDHTIKQIVQSVVKKIRASVTSKGIDPYTEKLKRFGNKGEWAKFKIQELEKIIYDEKKAVPSTFLGMWRSIEFEAIFKNEASMKEFVAAIRTKKTPYDKKSLSEFVTLKDDNSLRPDEDDKNGKAFCKEVCVTYKAGDEDLVEYVCAAMSSPGHHRAYINSTCGTHVHFDMRNMEEKQVRQYGERLGRCVPALKAILPKARRNNKYCLVAVNEMGRAADMHPDPHHIDLERYAFVNMKSYHRHKTIEVRGHSATLKADKILNWIALCEKIMTTRIRFKSETGEIKDPNDLITVYKLEPKLADYVKERFLKFNTVRDIPLYTNVAPREAKIVPPAPPWAAVPVPAPAVIPVAPPIPHE